MIFGGPRGGQKKRSAAGLASLYTVLCPLDCSSGMSLGLSLKNSLKPSLRGEGAAGFSGFAHAADPFFRARGQREKIRLDEQRILVKELLKKTLMVSR